MVYLSANSNYRRGMGTGFFNLTETGNCTESTKRNMTSYYQFMKQLKTGSPNGRPISTQREYDTLFEACIARL